MPAALLSICAVLASYGLMFAFSTRYGVGASPAMLAAALSMGLMRRTEQLTWRALLFKCVNLPLIALAAGLVGAMFLKAPVLGAVVFCTIVALSVWLRNFGAFATAIGRTIALPVLTMLAVPVRVGGGGPARTAVAVLVAGAVAFLTTSIASWIAQRIRITAEQRYPKPSQTQREGAMPIATRMALQMLVALALAFAIAMPLLHTHWSWAVLTAFIVCSGAIGRGDAIYKGLLRFAGAIAGTVAASLVGLIIFPNAWTYAATVFFVLFIGIWLRPINYAYWAACATLVFALLQGAHGAGAFALFGERIIGIAVGTVCAVAATWFVYPIRTEHVVRRRIANALAAVRELLAMQSEHPDRGAHSDALKYHIAELNRIAPPVRLHRALFRANDDGNHPATLIDRAHALLKHAGTPEFDRAHVGAQLRELGAILRGENDAVK
jgi:hypothetical protein